MVALAFRTALMANTRNLPLVHVHLVLMAVLLALLVLILIALPVQPTTLMFTIRSSVPQSAQPHAHRVSLLTPPSITSVNHVPLSALLAKHLLPTVSLLLVVLRDTTTTMLQIVVSQLVPMATTRI